MPHLKNFALNVGLLPGHRDYTRFVILGRSRSGSNFLRGLLNSHSQITVFGEIFQNDQSIGWALPGYRQSPVLFDRFRNEPVKFIEQNVYHRFPLQTKAVGFKIFYYHAKSENWKPVWSYLQSEKNIKIIHIKRQNVLKTHLSRKLAVKTDAWVNTSGAQQAPEQVALDYDELLGDFNQTRHWEAQAEVLFKDHPSFEVFYEDLARDYSAIMARIQSFLEVKSENVQAQTHKQTTQPLSFSITNYDELKMKFKDTPWASFFEEEKGTYSP